MDEYRLDIVDEAKSGDLICPSEYFDAPDLDTALSEARGILKTKATDLATQYGHLWMRDPDGGTSAEYAGTIEPGETPHGAQ